MRHVQEVLDELGWSTGIIAAGGARSYLKERKVEAQSWSPTLWSALLNDEPPEVFVTATSVNPLSPAHLVTKRFRELGVPTVGVVDAVKSAPTRFSGTAQDPLHYAPDWLLVPDEDTAFEFAALGFPRDKLVVTGHPHYDWVRREARIIVGELREQSEPVQCRPKTRASKTTAVFVAEPPEPSSSPYRADGLIRGWGESDDRVHVALQEVLDAFSITPEAPSLVLRLHPRNDPTCFEPYARHLADVSSRGDPLQLLLNADLVIGLTSSLVFEAAILGRPTIAIIAAARERILIPAAIRPTLITVEKKSELIDSLELWRNGNWPIGSDSGYVSSGANANLRRFFGSQHWASSPMALH